MPGSWLMASVRMERMMATSSAIRAVYGSSSEIQAPLCPCWWNSKTEGAIGKRACPEVMVVRRCP